MTSNMKYFKHLGILSFVVFFLGFLSFTQIDEDYGTSIPYASVQDKQGQSRPESLKKNYSYISHMRKLRRQQRKLNMGRWDLEDMQDDFSQARAVVSQLRWGRVSQLMLSSRLQGEIKKYVDANRHNVNFVGHRLPFLSRHDLLCQLRNQMFRLTLDGKEEPFSSQGWQTVVPDSPLEDLFGANLKTCAVVSSAGAILNSSLGKDIGESVYRR